MPVLPVTTYPGDHQVDWFDGESTKDQSALQSRFSVDSSAYQVNPDASHQQRLQSWRSAEGFGNRPNDSARVADFAIVPTRPPLKPTVSFGAVSAYSYYSSATDELEKKSQQLAVEEERQSSVRLYASIAVLCCLNLLCGLNVTTLAVALPTIAHDLNTSAVQSFWLVNTYLVSAGIIQPISMRLSAAVGNKSLLSFGLLLWAVGSIISASANTTTLLLLGRAVTGLGGGVASVLVPLVLRQLQPQKYTRAEQMVSLSYWLGTFVGAIVGGALAQPETWRYIFYLNLPVCLLALASFPLLLQLPSSEGCTWTNLLRIDYIGWFLLSGSITSFSLAISWAGIGYSWTAMQNLVPLITGAVCCFCWILRSLYAEDSILPVSLFRKTTGVVSCLSSMIHGIIFVGLVYFTPFLLSIGAELTPTICALTLSPYTLGLSLLSLVGGITIVSFHGWAAWASWAIVATGVGLLIIIKEAEKQTISILISIVVGMALGVLAGSLSATIQSTATNDDETIHAAPLSVFFNTIGHAFGLAVGSCVFLNRLGHATRSSPYLAGNANMYTLDGVRMAYVTQHLSADQPGLKAHLVDAYMDALHWVWILLSILAGIAFILSTYNLVATRIGRSDVRDDQEKQDCY